MSLSAHCSSEDRTPTFTSHVQGRRFRRVVELYTPDSADPKQEQTEKNNLHDVRQPVISLIQMESKDSVDPPSEGDPARLEERVEALETKIESMTTALASLGEAVNNLQNQVSIYSRYKLQQLLTTVVKSTPYSCK